MDGFQICAQVGQRRRKRQRLIPRGRKLVLEPALFAQEIGKQAAAQRAVHLVRLRIFDAQESLGFPVLRQWESGKMPPARRFLRLAQRGLLVLLQENRRGFFQASLQQRRLFERNTRDHMADALLFPTVPFIQHGDRGAAVCQFQYIYPVGMMKGADMVQHRVDGCFERISIQHGRDTLQGNVLFRAG